MNSETARELLSSLLERLEADAKRPTPQFLAVVSSAEREAIRNILSAPLSEDISASSGVAKTDRILSPNDAVETERVAAFVEPVPPATAVSGQFVLNSAAIEASNKNQTDLILCFDFGTARSKVFAATQDEEPTLFEIPLGRLDSDSEGAVYGINSAVWIEADGRVFLGSSAFQRSIAAGIGENLKHHRLDSIKQRLSQITGQVDLSRRHIEVQYNPSGQPLTYEHAITLYLSYMTDLATSYLATQGLNRYARRRFTLPWWEDQQREWAERNLSRYLCRAQLLADTFHDRWSEGIPASEIIQAIEQASALDDQSSYLLGPTDEGSRRAVLEPLAAGSARLLRDRDSRDLVLIVDTGAGTTDISLFFVVQRQRGDFHIGHPVAPCGRALRIAGDQIDSFLAQEIILKAHLGADEALRKRISDALWQQGVRRLKEQLFETGRLQVKLPNDMYVELTLDDFLGSDGIRRFEARIKDEIQQFLDEVDPSWANIENISLVLTGGGATLPMISGLCDGEWRIGGRTKRLAKVDLVPEFIRQSYSADFQREYPSLAVAIGGAYTLIDEKNPYKIFAGNTAPTRLGHRWV